FNVSVREVGDRIIFMRKLRPGGSQHRFGIHVAQLAGMPNRVVFRANEILRFLDQDKHKNNGPAWDAWPPPAANLNLFEAHPRLRDLQELLDKIDIDTISPVEAWLKLNEVIGILGKG